MRDSVVKKLQTLSQRHRQVSTLLADSSVIKDQDRYRELSKEYAQWGALVNAFHSYEALEHEITKAKELLKDCDSDMEQLINEEIRELAKKRDIAVEELKILLLPQDPNDEHNVFLEIRAGTGGQEAALFAGDLFRMYGRYAEMKGWKVSPVSMHEGERGGFKEVIVRISGQRVYSQLKFESGVHRVQRVPLTEAQGRIHTSACTVAILPEAEEIDHIEIDPADLRIDTFRASGAGGQHVNRTDSAVRLTHLPSGVVVECQDERSQHKNKARAFSLLQARLLAAERSKREQQQAEQRRSLIGTGDRSERIRTYNFPQGRITDHRVNLTLYQLDKVLAGELDLLIGPLSREFQAEQLSQLGGDS